MKQALEMMADLEVRSQAETSVNQVALALDQVFGGFCRSKLHDDESS